MHLCLCSVAFSCVHGFPLSMRATMPCFMVLCRFFTSPDHLCLVLPCKCERERCKYMALWHGRAAGCAFTPRIGFGAQSIQPYYTVQQLRAALKPHLFRLKHDRKPVEPERRSARGNRGARCQQRIGDGLLQGRSHPRRDRAGSSRCRRAKGIHGGSRGGAHHHRRTVRSGRPAPAALPPSLPLQRSLWTPAGCAAPTTRR